MFRWRLRSSNEAREAGGEEDPSKVPKDKARLFLGGISRFLKELNVNWEEGGFCNNRGQDTMDEAMEMSRP